MAKKAHRKAKIDFRARRSLRQLHLQLRYKPLADWPPALSDARRILTGELALEPAKALAVILKSVSVAHDSIRAQNKQLETTSSRLRHGQKSAKHAVGFPRTSNARRQWFVGGWTKQFFR